VAKWLPFVVSKVHGFFIIKEQIRLPQPGSDQIANGLRPPTPAFYHTNPRNQVLTAKNLDRAAKAAT
jgi:hypothetical protein